jgi:hypothetical protein
MGYMEVSGEVVITGYSRIGELLATAGDIPDA